jgi:hypothetical protein
MVRRESKGSNAHVAGERDTRVSHGVLRRN